MDRAYSLLTVKSIDEDQRIITGIASTPSVDRMDDIVMPQGMKAKFPVPLLWQHDARKPVGHVLSAKVTDAGIQVTCSFVKVDEPPSLKDELDRAWAMVKSGLVRAFSIGFNSLESSDIEGSWGRRFTSWELLELSCVTIPANSDCSIQTVKSFDRQQRAALGHKPRAVVRLGNTPPPGASGTKAQPASSGSFFAQNPKGTDMKTIAERIAEFEAKKAENLAKMTELVNKSVETGETLDADQEETHKTLSDENAQIDKHVVLLTSHQAQMAKSAKPVEENKGAGSTVTVNGGVIAVKSNLPKGTGLTRIAMAIGHSKGNLVQAASIAKRWGDTPQVGQVLQAMADFGSSQFTKAAVAVGDSNTSGWASQLVYYSDMASEFIDLLRPRTIIGRVPGLRRVPFNIRYGSTLTGTSSGWVGENAPIPVSAMSFSSGTLGHAKAASLVVITKELAAFSNPAAEALVRDDMMNAMTQFLDTQFISPSVAASANVSPASITNGLSPVTSTGSSVSAIYADVQSLLTLFAAAELDTSDCVWVMKPATALALMMKRTSQDIAIFPDINQAGGTWFGMPVVTSNAVPGSVSGGSIIVLIKPSEVFFADDGGITLDVSNEASVQMVDNPSAGAASLVSLFQNDLVGLRAVREINWQRRRTASVNYIDAVAY